MISPLDNSASLITVVIAIGLAIIVLLILLLVMIGYLIHVRGVGYWPGRSAGARDRATGKIARLTRLLSPHADRGAGPARYRLVVRHGGPIGREYALVHLNTFIGADCALVDLVLEDDYVSGRHAGIQYDDERLYVTDLSSSNGTYLNDTPLLPQVRTALDAGDRLAIGGLILECVRSDVTPASIPFDAANGVALE